MVLLPTKLKAEPKQPTPGKGDGKTKPAVVDRPRVVVKEKPGTEVKRKT